jgi:hypothetical protein
VLRSGGVVEGDDGVAERLRASVDERAPVHALPPPSRGTPLPGVDVETKYEPDVDDAPEPLRAELREARRAAVFE